MSFEPDERVTIVRDTESYFGVHLVQGMVGQAGRTSRDNLARGYVSVNIPGIGNGLLVLETDLVGHQGPSSAIRGGGCPRRTSSPPSQGSVGESVKSQV